MAGLEARRDDRGGAHTRIYRLFPRLGPNADNGRSGRFKCQDLKPKDSRLLPVSSDRYFRLIESSTRRPPRLEESRENFSYPSPLPLYGLDVPRESIARPTFDFGFAASWREIAHRDAAELFLKFLPFELFAWS